MIIVKNVEWAKSDFAIACDFDSKKRLAALVGCTDHLQSGYLGKILVIRKAGAVMMGCQAKTTILAAIVAIAGICAAISNLSADTIPAQHQVRSEVAQAIRAVLATPDGQLDFARAKLTFDKMIDPTIDIDAWMQKIAQMEQAVRTMAGPSASRWEKLGAIQKYIYESGQWNDHRPYVYDLTDPLGKNITNKLLTTYLSTRRGNCVSMPFLFLILANRLGEHVTASTAPLHIFVRVVDDMTGKSINLEPTNGAGPQRDVWIRQQFPMTDQAIANGLYLQTLTKKETIALMASVVLEYYYNDGRYLDVIQSADVILEYYPKLVAALVTKGSAYGRLVEVNFEQKYPTPNDIPINLRAEYQRLHEQNYAIIDQAEALGWRPEE
jgi:regulator of sirC expression with transglutaminase-like and TPR domain